ncbi:MAG: 50S ribosomal protein L11 methyltransferase [Anaerolineales bacterium]|nr:50S ribosomal protein L11 methyltransferase [Anaerolineales bacterium]
MDHKDHATWLEVALIVDGEIAEAVAEVLARFIPDGIVIESTQILSDPYDEGRPVGPLRVYGYLPVVESAKDPMIEQTRRCLEESFWYLGRIRPVPAPLFKIVQQSDWAETWKQHYHPIPIGQRLMVIPSWLNIPLQGRVALRIDPGMAFGTGTHPTTRLCLEIIESLLDQVKQPVDLTAIDVGCGSGILAIAALKLGLNHALGVDKDPEAIPIARKNAADNGVAPRLELGIGSVVEIRRGTFGLRRAPLVLVNILAPIIIQLLDDGLTDLLEPGGSLVLSGILENQLSGDDKLNPIAVLPVLERHSLVVQERRQVDDWVALVVKLDAFDSI